MATHYPRPPVKGPVVIPNCVQVIVRSQLAPAGVSQGFVSNVLHGTFTGAALTGNEASAIYASLTAAPATTTYLAHVHPSYSIYSVRVKDLRTKNLPTFEFIGAPSHPGTSVGFELSAGSALVVSLRTAQSGKGFFGRVYLAGITQDNLTDARHFAASIGPIAMGYVNAIQSAMASVQFSLGIAQRQLAANTDPNAPPNQAQIRNANVVPVTSIRVTDFRIDSQRKRLGKPTG